jgi:hypothetical protein
MTAETKQTVYWTVGIVFAILVAVGLAYGLGFIGVTPAQ